MLKYSYVIIFEIILSGFKSFFLRQNKLLMKSFNEKKTLFIKDKYKFVSALFKLPGFIFGSAQIFDQK